MAVPVAPAHTVEALYGIADEVVAAETPEPFLAIGQLYADFTQTGDGEVARLLATPGSHQLRRRRTTVRACEIDLGPVRLAGDLAAPVGGRVPPPIGQRAARQSL